MNEDANERIFLHFQVEVANITFALIKPQPF